jgi:hypothetical protein
MDPRGPPSPPVEVRGFIVGMSRAGTTWLAKCLNEHPHAVVFGETAFWGRGYVAPGADGLYGAEHLRAVRAWLDRADWLRPMVGAAPGCYRTVRMEDGPRLLDRALGQALAPLTPAQLFTRIASAIGDAEGKPFAIEKTPHHVNWIGRIFAAMPKSRFVVMLRDPFEFMLSYKHQGDRLPESTRREFESRYHPFGCAVVCRGYLRAAERAAQRFPDRVLIVRFDELTRSPATQLDRVQRFLGLEPVDLAGRVPPDNTSFPAEAAGDGAARPALRGEDVFWMSTIAGRDIHAFGAAPPRVSREPLRVIGSMLTLPAWALRNLRSMRGVTSGSIWSYLGRWWRPDRE